MIHHYELEEVIYEQYGQRRKEHTIRTMAERVDAVDDTKERRIVADSKKFNRKRQKCEQYRTISSKARIAEYKLLMRACGSCR